MHDISLEWDVNEQGKKIIKSQGINHYIEINEDNKEVKNAKAFFREIIYQSFLNNWDRTIVLSNNEEIEITEVNDILTELVMLCNTELKALKEAI